MPQFWSRRDFLRSAAAGVAARPVLGGGIGGIPHPMRPPRPLPPQSRWAAKPVAIASANGLRAVQKALDRKSTRLNSSHTVISYAVFCLKKKIFGHTSGRDLEEDAQRFF